MVVVSLLPMIRGIVRCRRWLVGALASGVALASLALVVFVLGPAAWGVEAPPPAERTTQRLQQRKLLAEIRQLEQQIEQNRGLPAVLLRFGPLATAVAAVVTAGVGVNKYLAEERNRRNEEQRQREADRRQREAESLRRFDEAFAQSLGHLGSESERERAAGAASLNVFLKPRYRELAGDILPVLVANLKLEQPAVVRDLLRGGFERALRLYTEERSEDWIPELDLTHTDIQRVNLEGVNLEGMTLDVAFADLRRANLTGLDLRGLLGYGVDLREARLSRANLQEARLNAASADGALFHEARLVSATFEQEASLVGAEFHQALLQSSHFEGADLTGAQFQQANVNDAFFSGATFDEPALRTLLRTRDGSWRQAHLDKEAQASLEALAAEEE